MYSVIISQIEKKENKTLLAAEANIAKKTGGD
jgi:hypothetical protein